jgi:hypothetical protein
MKTRQFLCLVAAFVVAGGVGIAAEADPPASDPDRVPLFTNEDLAKYGSSDAPNRPVAAAVAAANQDWTFVNKFIEGQYEKIKTEREYAMELSERDARRYEQEWDGWSGRLLLAPRSPLWWYAWHDYYAVYPTPYDKHGIRTHSNEHLTGHSSRSGRVVRSGYRDSGRIHGGRPGASSGRSGHGGGSGRGGGSRH